VNTKQDKSFQQCVLDYEVAIDTTETTTFITATLSLLDGINHACRRGGFVEKGAATASREHWYTRAAAALTRVIVHPKITVGMEGLVALTRRKQTIAYIFSASGYRTMKHLVDLVQDRTDDGSTKINVARGAVLLVFIGLDDVPDGLMDIALRQPPNVLLHLMLGWLNQRAVLTAQGEKNRSKLLTSGHLLEACEIKDADIAPLINAWMYSSYASEPKKHDIKRWLNKLLVKRMTKAGITPLPVTHSVKARPKILVIHERFNEQHAMYRCYAPLIAQLGERFETVAMADAATIDEAADAFFDEVIKLPTPRPSITALRQLVQEQKPDMIYYPSLGMSHWTVMLAALRLAPIQVMSHGHPATSMLPTIDYAYISCVEGRHLDQINSERVVTSSLDVVFQAHTELPEDLPELVAPSEREVRIAVNSKVMKLSSRLLDVCKRIEQEARVPVRFSFFPGERFSYMDGLEAAIKKELPSATVMPYTGYGEFLKAMCQCDMALAAFPFGNTNSTVDTCLLGLPTVAHFGPEAPAQTDALVLKAAGLADWLICKTDDAYFETAVRLVNDPSARIEAMGGLDRQTLRQRLLVDQSGLGSDPLGELLFQLHRHHGSIRNLEKRSISAAELLSMTN